MKETDTICFKQSEQNAKKCVFIREEVLPSWLASLCLLLKPPTHMLSNFALGALCLRNAQKKNRVPVFEKVVKKRDFSNLALCD